MWNVRKARSTALAAHFFPEQLIGTESLHGGEALPAREPARLLPAKMPAIRAENRRRSEPIIAKKAANCENVFTACRRMKWRWEKNQHTGKIG